MKKLLSVFGVFALCLTFASCDKEEGEAPETLTGTWESYHVWLGGYCLRTLEFTNTTAKWTTEYINTDGTPSGGETTIEGEYAAKWGVISFEGSAYPYTLIDGDLIISVPTQGGGGRKRLLRFTCARNRAGYGQVEVEAGYLPRVGIRLF